ncbi:MAG: deoxyribodipyrimidine photo-lyase, partial [Rhodoglobus sp.]
MSERATSVVWLRDDLRLADNPALTAAVERGGPVVVLYLLDDVSTGIRALGAASRWWLHHSLAALAASLEAIGGRLRLERGSAASVIPSVIAETGATTVFWNRRYSAARHIDAELTATLRQAGVQAQSFHANLLFEPGTVLTGDGGPYRVFTPFWRACLESGEPRHPLPAPTAIEAADAGGDALADWQLLPTAPDWAPGLRETWTPGEAAAAHALDHFADSVLADYHLRDQPSQQVTSHLSPHLRFGEVSPFQVWHRLRDLTPDAATNAAKFLSELGWREFNWSTLFHFPELATSNFRPAFDAFPWKEPDPRELEAWQRGRTGIPLVDAGMRELWRTGYMH